MRLLSALLLAVGCAAALGSPVVKIESGLISGYTDSGVNVFKGVPYAASTAGANRWSPPQPRESWSGVLNCTSFGPGCPQTHHNPDVPKEQSEDCLNLNIYVPASASRTPVMAFIHGGAFLEGSNRGAFGLYDGVHMAQHGVCVFTMNYRLGALGFLATSSLEGNYGLKDQRAALQWIQRNAERFGCDPGQVTVWGESAGAMSIGIHLVSPASAGLFHRAVMESNPLGYRYRSRDDAAIYGATFAGNVGCGDSTNLTCLREASLESVLSATDKSESIWKILKANLPHILDAFLPWVPSSETEDFPEQVLTAVERGNYHKGIPVLIGTNQNEGSTFIFSGVSKLPWWAYDAGMALLFKLRAPDVLEQYKVTVVPPLNLSMDAREPLSVFLTDFWFRCASQRLAALIARDGTPTFVYRYNHILSFAPAFAHMLPAICQTKTCHASELPVVFGNSGEWNFTEPEQGMVNSALDFWSAFARAGNPNAGPSQPVPWPTFTGSERPVLRLATPLALEGHEDSTVCDFWDGMGYMKW